jgi:PAS domain-containing protein
VKPFHKEELRANVEIALSTYQEEQQVEQRLEEVSEMLDNIDDAIATVNTNGRVTYMNATAQAYANPDPQADNPRDVETLFRVVDPSSGERVTTDHPVRQVLGGGAVKPGTEVTLRTRNGQHHRVHIITASLIQRDGQTVGAVWAFGPAGVSGPGGVTEGAAADASGDAARERLELIESLLKELGMSEEQIDTAIERMRARQRS